MIAPEQVRGKLCNEDTMKRLAGIIIFFNFFELSFITAIKHLLCHSLVRSVILFGIVQLSWFFNCTQNGKTKQLIVGAISVQQHIINKPYIFNKGCCKGHKFYFVNIHFNRHQCFCIAYLYVINFLKARIFQHFYSFGF